jgi:hypothetical protein
VLYATGESVPCEKIAVLVLLNSLSLLACFQLVLGAFHDLVGKVCCFGVLLLDCLHTLPSTAQPLFPQADAVVAGADSQYVAAQAPAHAPGDGIDVENGGLPVTCNLLAKMRVMK